MLTTFPFLAARGRQIMSQSHEITTFGFLVDLFKNDGKIYCALSQNYLILAIFYILGRSSRCGTSRFRSGWLWCSGRRNGGC